MYRTNKCNISRVSYICSCTSYSNEFYIYKHMNFILFEYTDGSLIKYIQSHQESNKIIPEKRIFQLFLDIVNATYLLHAQRPPITHRHVKIDNILIRNLDNNTIRCVNGTPKYFMILLKLILNQN